jgi:hypothetical protein
VARKAALCTPATACPVSHLDLCLTGVARRAPGRASERLSPGADAGPAAPQAPLARWEQVEPYDEDYLPSGRRLLRSVAERLQWENALAEARRRAQEALAAEVSATGRAA